MWLRDKINEQLTTLKEARLGVTDEQNTIQEKFNTEVERLKKTFSDKANALSIELVKIEAQIKILEYLKTEEPASDEDKQEATEIF